MRRIVFLTIASLVWGLGVGAQQHNIDTEKSTLTIHVGKTGAFSGFGHEHEVSGPIHSGTADTGSRPTVEVHVNARELRVTGKDEPEKDRAEVQKTMLGPEVLDSSHFPQITFASSSVERSSDGVFVVHGQLSLHGTTRPVVGNVRVENGSYKGSCTLKQRDFGIAPISIAGGTVKVKDELKIEFVIRTVTTTGRVP